jgi:hypothetical protein
MPLKLQAIEHALLAQPLCGNVLKNPSPESKARCAAGALLAAIGVSDEELLERDASRRNAGADLWADYGERLHDAYGIDNSGQLDAIIDSNDSNDSIERVLAVDSSLAALIPSLENYSDEEREWETAPILPSVLACVREMAREQTEATHA